MKNTQIFMINLLPILILVISQITPAFSQTHDYSGAIVQFFLRSQNRRLAHNGQSQDIKNIQNLQEGQFLLQKSGEKYTFKNIHTNIICDQDFKCDNGNSTPKKFYLSKHYQKYLDRTAFFIHKSIQQDYFANNCVYSDRSTSDVNTNSDCSNNANILWEMHIVECQDGTNDCKPQCSESQIFDGSTCTDLQTDLPNQQYECQSPGQIILKTQYCISSTYFTHQPGYSYKFQNLNNNNIYQGIDLQEDYPIIKEIPSMSTVQVQYLEDAQSNLNLLFDIELTGKGYFRIKSVLLNNYCRQFEDQIICDQQGKKEDTYYDQFRFQCNSSDQFIYCKLVNKQTGDLFLTSFTIEQVLVRE